MYLLYIERAVLNGKYVGNMVTMATNGYKAHIFNIFYISINWQQNLTYDNKWQQEGEL